MSSTALSSWDSGAQILIYKFTYICVARILMSRMYKSWMNLERCPWLCLCFWKSDWTRIASSIEKMGERCFFTLNSPVYWNWRFSWVSFLPPFLPFSLHPWLQSRKYFAFNSTLKFSLSLWKHPFKPTSSNKPPGFSQSRGPFCVFSGKLFSYYPVFPWKWSLGGLTPTVYFCMYTANNFWPHLTKW